MVPFIKRKSVTAGQTHAQCKYVSLSPCESVMYLLVKDIVICVIKLALVICLKREFYHH